MIKLRVIALHCCYIKFLNSPPALVGALRDIWAEEHHIGVLINECSNEDLSSDTQTCAIKSDSMITKLRNNFSLA